MAGIELSAPSAGGLGLRPPSPGSSARLVACGPRLKVDFRPLTSERVLYSLKVSLLGGGGEEALAGGAGLQGKGP